MNSRKSMIRALGAGLVVVLGAGALLAGAAPASAGPSCRLGCSTTVNDSPYIAMALFNWCVGSAGTGDSTPTRPTCRSEGASQKSLNLFGGGHTPYDQDWDTLQVDAGWCYKVKFVITAAPDFTRTYDRRGKAEVWVKVANNADAHILAQGSATCP